MQSRSLALPNSLILVMDPTARDIPRSMGDLLVSATTSVVAIGCRAEVDGETEVRLGNDWEVDLGTAPAFIGPLDVPTGIVSVRTVLGEEILLQKVGRRRVTLRVWTDDSSEPTLIGIGVS